MKKASKLLAMSLAVIMLCFLCACGGTAQPSTTPTSAPAAASQSAPEATAEPAASQEYTYPEMTIQMGHISTEGEYDMYNILAKAFAKNVDELSGGKIQIDIIANGQLGGERDMLEGMQIGTLDCGIIGNDTIAIVNDMNYVAMLPYMFTSNQDVWTYIDSEDCATVSQSVYDNQNVKVLGYGCIGFRNVLNNEKPIHTPADLANMKLRVIESSLMIDIYTALGTNPTPMAYSELITSLQQGTVDGCDFPIATAYTSRLFDVCKYLSETRAYFNLTTISMSRGFYDKLDPQVQELLVEAGRLAGIEEREYCDELEQTMLGWLQDEGMIVNSDVDFAAFQEAVQPVYDKYMDIVGADFFHHVQETIAAGR